MADKPLPTHWPEDMIVTDILAATEKGDLASFLAIVNRLRITRLDRRFSLLRNELTFASEKLKTVDHDDVKKCFVHLRLQESLYRERRRQRR